MKLFLTGFNHSTANFYCMLSWAISSIDMALWLKIFHCPDKLIRIKRWCCICKISRKKIGHKYFKGIQDTFKVFDIQVLVGYSTLQVLGYH